ncbi:MAG TPA: M56 family metallopeptidase [Longimicrobiales bacterium]|nr:M56 family metallopeptidase [Longimicrobiales bacterium]
MDTASSWARPAVEAVLNGVWQGILLVAVLALGMRLARRANAASRYAVWWLTLLAVAALPAVGWTWRRALEGVLSFGAPFAGGAEAGPALLLPAGPWPELLLVAWLGSSGILLLRVARGYRSMQALKERSEPLSDAEAALFRDLLEGHDGRRPIRIRRSRELPSPITAGLANPMILMPADLLNRLDDGDLRRIVLHELTHVRRGDDRAILLQRFIEAFFFFNPAVRFVAGRLDLEREVACDDRVIALTGERKAYARCLAHLAELGVVRDAALASGALLHRGHLVRRVTLLLDGRRRVGERVSSALAGGALAVLGTAVLWLGAQAPVLGVPPGAAGEQVAVDGGEGLQPTLLTPEEALRAAPLPARLPTWEPVRVSVDGPASSASVRREPAVAAPTPVERSRPVLAGAADTAARGRALDASPRPVDGRAERALAEDEDEDEFRYEEEALPFLEAADALSDDAAHAPPLQAPRRGTPLQGGPALPAGGEQETSRSGPAGGLRPFAVPGASGLSPAPGEEGLPLPPGGARPAESPSRN